jgi:non-specific serine/threonine protein kinase
MVAAASPPTRPVRSLGRFELRQLLGKSAHSMSWLVFDPRNAQELMLVLPRIQPADAAALDHWMQAARQAARLNHPNLAHAVEVGQQDRWPYVAYDRAAGSTLAERMSRDGHAAADAARWIAQALEGLAFAHEAGVTHRDLQPHMLLLNDAGQLRVMGFEVALDDGSAPAEGSVARTLSMDTTSLRTQRTAAQRDVLALGLVLHQLLAAQPVLDEPDVGLVIERLPPHGRDIVRLPWSIPRPVPEALRAIVNRATDRQQRQRYHNARTLARALQGWLEAESAQGGGAHALLLDRVRQIGALPAAPGGAARAARLALLEREHTDELAHLVLKDLALAFELLRVVNTAQVRGSQVAGNGPVLTVRRAIAMIGLDGVRRAAQGLRHWPGPMGEAAAHELSSAIERVRRAGRLAQRLRPAGYDAEVVYLVTLLQNLGRLLVQYHFADEAAQIRRLMQPEESQKPGEPDEPGMSEELAAFAVLGADIESMGAAVARYWGMDEAVLHMIRRLPLRTPVRHSDSDDDTLRAVGSAANEAIDALALPPKQVAPALDKVAQRYSRVLDLTPRDLQAAVQVALQSTEPERDNDMPVRDATPAAQPQDTTLAGSDI